MGCIVLILQQPHNEDGVTDRGDEGVSVELREGRGDISVDVVCNSLQGSLLPCCTSPRLVTLPEGRRTLFVMPTLYVVATPIGNLRDITIRALEMLREVSAIVCEDTRHSSRLLSHHGIRKPLVSGHSHNERQSAAAVVARLEAGEDVAYITDAGTPGISDPGRTLVRVVRDAGYRVVPIPGPSATATIASVNAFPGKTVIFEGFLSPKAGRRKGRLKELLAMGETFILYESPHRLVKLLTALADLEPERDVLLGREMTKMHEEFVESTAKQLLEIMETRPVVKGECVLLVGPPKKG